MLSKALRFTNKPNPITHCIRDAASLVLLLTRHKYNSLSYLL